MGGSASWGRCYQVSPIIVSLFSLWTVVLSSFLPLHLRTTLDSLNIFSKLAVACSVWEGEFQRLNAQRFHSGGTFWSKFESTCANCCPRWIDADRYKLGVGIMTDVASSWICLISLWCYVSRSACLPGSISDQRLSRCLWVPGQPGLRHDERGQHRLHRNQHLCLFAG